MEDNSIIDAAGGSGELKISSRDISFLNETRKWAGFLAILGFVMTGLIVLAALFAGSLISYLGQVQGQAQAGNLPDGFGGVLSFVYVAGALLYFFPTLYLYRFSRQLKIALENKDSEALTTAFSNQKSMFKFIGIFTAITLGIYALAFIFGLLAGMLA
ncbi:MAG: DUF5362 family protein [Reichenbachiella sp.]|uniref:DUF5362 family protein n=1 Tax=Reichenbachiella sp. TaxID=2184521 RepID=UPI0032644B9F